MDENVLVSIVTLVYNHGRFLDDYFRGILRQKIDFRIEVIIHDDSSTDESASIIKKYSLLYPDLIKPIYQKKNQYSQNVDVLDKFIFPYVQGKYIALCEGDDYWNDPLKLQKQVDILEKNKDYGFIYTDYHQVNEDGSTMEDVSRHDLFKKKFRSGDLFYQFFQGNFPQTCTVMFRKGLYDSTCFSEGSYDYTLYMFFAGLTKFYYLDEDTACYRLQSQGATISGALNGERYQRLTHFTLRMCSQRYLNGYFYKRGGLEHLKIMCRITQHMMIAVVKNWNRKEAFSLMLEQPIQYLFVIPLFIFLFMRQMFRFIKQVLHHLALTIIRNLKGKTQ